MNDPHFPSGPWTGFFNYEAGGTRHRTDVSLSFAEGQITGDGADGVGRYAIAGRFDAASRECWWTKHYLGAHEVAYHGFGEGRGIWGTWELEGKWRGGFHLWPLGDEVQETIAAHAEQTLPAAPAKMPELQPTSGLARTGQPG